MKITETLKNKLPSIFSSHSKTKKCSHDDFWSLYKIINFHRKSLRGTCGLCGKEVQLEYLGTENYRKYPLVVIFSCILWISPAILIIIIAGYLATIYGPWIYFLAIIDVVIFHFWAIYYIIRGGLIKIKEVPKK